MDLLTAWGAAWEAAVRPSPTTRLKSSPKAAKRAAPAAPTTDLQPLSPAVPWDWPVDGSGTTSSAKWTFCDTMPASWGGGAVYARGTESFTSNYRAFLDALDPARLGDRVKAARAALDDASNQTTVLFAETPPAARPAWLASQTPVQFAASVAGAKPRTIELPVAADDRAPQLVVGLGGSGPTALDAHFTHVVITADGFGAVTLSPSGWYDSGLVSSARTPDAFRPGYAPRRRDLEPKGNGTWIFGRRGLLQSRSVSLLVALNPRARAKPRPTEAAVGVDTSSGARLAGIEFGADELVFGPDGSLSGARASDRPMLLGVRVEPIRP